MIRWVPLAVVLGSCGAAASPQASPASAGDPDLAVEARSGAPLAVTLDDLPFVGPLAPGDSEAAAMRRIVAALEAADAPATGFVVCDRWSGAPEALDAWVESGRGVGNHSTSHRDIDALDEEAWRADVAGCRDRLTERLGDTPRWFRYPMLHTGADRGRRDAGFETLRRLGHERAPVSVDTAEWVLAEPYVDALRRGDGSRAAAIAEAYVEHLRLATRHYRRVAEQRVGQPIAHVLLLHANALAADHLPAVLAMLRDEGFSLVSLEEAMADPVYRRPDAWVDPVGASWLYRIEPPSPEAWGWDRGQQRALEERFAGRSPSRHRIGEDLVVVPVEGEEGRAWRVVHDRAPAAASSLVYLTRGGEPVLADTPWTDAATRDLLDWVRLRFGRPPALATIGHFHLDASGGVGALREAGIRVVASGATEALMRERLGEMRRELGVDPVPHVPPDTLFELTEGWSAEVGGEEVRVFFPGPAHTRDNVVTYFPERRLLFGGCMVKGGDDLGYLGDADVAAYASSVARLEALSPRTVVSGHGDRTDPGQLANTRALAERAAADTASASP